MYFVHCFSILMWLILPFHFIPKEKPRKEGYYQYMKLTRLLPLDVIAIKKASSWAILV